MKSRKIKKNNKITNSSKHLTSWTVIICPFLQGVKQPSQWAPLLKYPCQLSQMYSILHTLSNEKFTTLKNCRCERTWRFRINCIRQRVLICPGLFFFLLFRWKKGTISLKEHRWGHPLVSCIIKYKLICRPRVCFPRNWLGGVVFWGDFCTNFL